jgi:hypothetical protein
MNVILGVGSIGTVRLDRRTCCADGRVRRVMRRYRRSQIIFFRLARLFLLNIFQDDTKTTVELYQSHRRRPFVCLFVCLFVLFASNGLTHHPREYRQCFSFARFVFFSSFENYLDEPRQYIEIYWMSNSDLRRMNIIDECRVTMWYVALPISI